MELKIVFTDLGRVKNNSFYLNFQRQYYTSAI